MATVKKATVTNSGSILSWAFAHGEELIIDAAELANNIKESLLVHGLRQKISDSYAGCTTPQEAMEAARSVAEALSKGEWSSRGTGEGGSRVTQLAKALSMVTGQPLEAAVEVVSNMSDENKKNLGANAQIKLAIATIQAEKARAAAEEAAKQEGPSIADILAAATAPAEQDAA